ncbi:MAG: hypothetical protein PHR00_00975 [Patescibacteria group bacterium]|nr:hypothetical protein [Patescibacteria group bacterium]
MFYKHKNFIIDIDLRKVFDENHKELAITGNAYLTLVFLCNHGSANVTDIGYALDMMKDYNEDHIRQYRYKINTIIGYKVVKYENKIYFIDGKIEKIESEDPLVLDKKDRITDSLRSDDVKFSQKRKFLNKKMILNKKILIIVLSLLALIGGYWLVVNITNKPLGKIFCNIKGNVSVDGEKIYHLPNCLSYEKVVIEAEKGEGWFCSEQEAKDAGWRKALNCK